MKLGTLGLPSYRSFSLEELEAATNNFETSAFMGEGSYGQVSYNFMHINLSEESIHRIMLYIFIKKNVDSVV